MNPITGIVGCCAPTENGNTDVAPSSVMNSRRLMDTPPGNGGT
jgi:hypothetical protein